MISSVRENIERLKPQLSSVGYKSLLNELDLFSVDPQNLDSALGGPSLTNDGMPIRFLGLA